MPTNRPHARCALKPIVLTDRDTQVLRHVADFGVLSTEQLHRLCFTSVSRARKRLRLLWGHRFVHRTTRPVRMGEGTSPHLYTLTARGKGYVSQTTPAKNPIAVARVSLGLHAQRIADFRIALLLATAMPDSPKLQTWRQGRELRFMQAVTGSPGTANVPLVSDAFFVLMLGGRDYAFFLEIDRGTTDLVRIRTKLQGYLSLWRSKTIPGALGVRSFRVLYVTTGLQRLQHMLELLQHLPGAPDRRDIVYFSTFADYSLDKPKRLLGPIWQTVDQAGTIRHGQLVPGSLPLTLPTVPANPAVRGPDAGAG